MAIDGLLGVDGESVQEDSDSHSDEALLSSRRQEEAARWQAAAAEEGGASDGGEDASRDVGAAGAKSDPREFQVFDALMVGIVGRSSSRRRRGCAVFAASGLAAVALIACAAALAASRGVWPQPWARRSVSSQGPPQLRHRVAQQPPRALRLEPAQGIFSSSEVHEAVAESLLRIVKGPLHSVDKEVLTSIVAESFQNISAKLRTSNPSMVGELDLLRLTEAQRVAVLHSLRLASDPRVQGLGLEVVALREELVPENLHKAWGHFSEDSWESSTVVPADLRLMETASIESWMHEIKRASGAANGTSKGIEVPEPYRQLFAQWSEAAPAGDGEAGVHVRPTDRSFGVVMVAEEFKFVLKLIFLCAHMPEKHLAYPAWSAFTAGHSDIDFGEISCELGTVMDFMKMFSCPLRFGAQGLDVLRASYSFIPGGSTPVQVL